MKQCKCFLLGLTLPVVFFSFNLNANTVSAEKELIQQMRAGGVVLMIRHALAPGAGDPANFILDDCSTQRNLNDKGRVQAKAIGEWLRARGVGNMKLYSSQWCRCLETARLMNLGSVTPLPALNSFFGRPEDREPNLSALNGFIHDNTKLGELIVMVTHQVTIAELTGQWTDSGHGKLIRVDKSGGIEFLGELDFSD